MFRIRPTVYIYIYIRGRIACRQLSKTQNDTVKRTPRRFSTCSLPVRNYEHFVAIAPPPRLPRDLTPSFAANSRPVVAFARPVSRMRPSPINYAPFPRSQKFIIRSLMYSVHAMLWRSSNVQGPFNFREVKIFKIEV